MFEAWDIRDEWDSLCAGGIRRVGFSGRRIFEMRGIRVIRRVGFSGLCACAFKR